MLIECEYQAPLSNLIKNEYNKLLNLICQIEDTKKFLPIIDGTGGKVTICDVIAYQIGWGNLLIGWYRAGLGGKIPLMPGEGFLKWDYVAIARHFYTKYHKDNFREQELQFYKVVSTLLDIVEYEYQQGRLDALGIWSWCTLPSGKQWSLSKWIRVNTVAPYKRASLVIKKVI